ncbi:MAG TPA: ABC-F family ATP-binding cassette domain-containing protein [Candidatus Saccharibacteria bacterium]|nr:ABC-F family ATP-binding cassette domain-containing protein [Candidatus Saccharibacteria bacterium]HMR38382.1 ABC-F family ATP-binding cassette domain-containing protein [Candidatus Saccharibacteria bacterium]
MLVDISVTEKSFGDKSLMKDIKFSVNEGEKVGVIGRNGVGKSTLFGILAGLDHDFTGEIIYRRGVTVVSTAQEHHGLGDQTVMSYILNGLPEYAKLKTIIDTYPDTMGENLTMIHEYTEALERFSAKDFYWIEEKIQQELSNFQLSGLAERPLASLSGGQKRLVEIVKIMHSDAHLALIDEPTNHMDFVAKQQFIDWLKASHDQAMLVITHDRDVLREVDRIVELKDGGSISFKGNYDAYLRQNTSSTSAAMTEYEMIERRKANLRDKVVQFRRLKEKARDPGTIQQFKRRENQAAVELAELEKTEKPSFWIDKDSVGSLNYKVAEKYDKFKARNIRMMVKDNKSRSHRVLVRAENLALGYGDTLLFEGVHMDLREGEAVELHGRNGAGKTTLIRALLGGDGSTVELPANTSRITVFDGELFLDPQARVGIYEQEIDEKYLDKPLGEAIERLYLDQRLPISATKVRQLASDYLFELSDLETPLSRLSGGQKSRFQLIKMLANDPQLLILDEPTNHLDLPSIEELEAALQKYGGAILFVSHDNYFREKMRGTVVKIGA